MTVERIPSPQTSNPYLEEFFEHYAATNPRAVGTVDGAIDHLESRGARFGAMTEVMHGRTVTRPVLESLPFQTSWTSAVIDKYAWAIPNDNALKTLARFAPIVEVGAGTGYWAMLLREMGVDVVAYDDGSWWRHCGTRWTDVIDGGPSELRTHGHRTLFLCWPPHQEPMARRCLGFYDGGTIALITPSMAIAGCDRFYERLNRSWQVVEVHAIPNHLGVDDDLRVYRRRSVHG